MLTKSTLSSSLSTVLVKSVLLFAASPGLSVAQNASIAQETTSLHSLPPAISTVASSSIRTPTITTTASSVNPSGSTQGGTSRPPSVFSNGSTNQPSHYHEETSTAATTTPGGSSSPSLTSLSSATTVTVTSNIPHRHNLYTSSAMTTTTVTSNLPHRHNLYTSSAMTTTTEKTISFRTFAIVVSVCVVVNVILLVFVVIGVVWTRRTRRGRSTEAPKKYARPAEDDITTERHYPSARFTNRPMERTNADHGADIDVCVDMENGDLDGEPVEVYEDSDEPAARPGYSSSSLTSIISASEGGGKERVKALANPTVGRGHSSSESAHAVGKAERGADRSRRPDPEAGHNRTLTDDQQGDGDAPLEAFENWESKFQ